jgi:hypothetical protein
LTTGKEALADALDEFHIQLRKTAVEESINKFFVDCYPLDVIGPFVISDAGRLR